MAKNRDRQDSPHNTMLGPKLDGVSLCRNHILNTILSEQAYRCVGAKFLRFPWQGVGSSLTLSLSRDDSITSSAIVVEETLPGSRNNVIRSQTSIT